MKLTQIATDITSALKEIDDLGKRVFPIVATEGTAYPYCVYERSSVTFNDTKDGDIMGVSYTIRIVSANYTSGLKIADDAIKTLKRMVSSNANTRYDIQLQNVTEEYTEDGFIQTIYITI